MSYTNKPYTDRHFYYFVHPIYISEASLNTTYVYCIDAVRFNSTTDYTSSKMISQLNQHFSKTQQKLNIKTFIL